MHKSQIEINLNDEELLDAKTLFDQFWKEDLDVRQQSLSKWRRLKFFWNNITNVWYDSVAHDWRIYTGPDGTSDTTGDQSYYDQRVNIFRAYLESIIAALSTTVPPVRCYPDDAENSADIETAKAGDKIAELLYRHNDVPLLWLHGLYVYMTEGFVAAECAINYNKKNGTYPVHEYDEKLETSNITTCPQCGFELDRQTIDPSMAPPPPPVPMEEQEMDFSALSTTAPPPSSMMDAPIPPPGMGGAPPGMDDPMAMMGPVMQEPCPNCGAMITPQVSQEDEIKTVWTGTSNEVKGRIKMCCYGGLNIKVPLYARSQEEVFYLYYAYETHYAQAIELYPDLHDDLSRKVRGRARGFDDYEQWARLNPEYRTGSYPIDNVTVKTGWFKPASYNILDEERAKHWHKTYPDGISLTFVNEIFACAKEQELDAHWTLTINPLSDFIQNDPIAMLLVSIQEITNDLISLTKQTIEHGVGLTFVDPQFIDLNAYGQTEVLPGSLIPTKTISGNKKLADGIYEVKTANLSGEVLPFAQQIQSLGQLVSGALPSLFGGSLEGSETASQYSMSKNQAQSRLGVIWKMFGLWWKNHFGKAIPMFISIMEVDEKDVKKRKDGSFINVLIRKSELSGIIGKVELEANENIPLTWGQRKDVVMQLLQTPNPQVVQMLMAPENLDVLREAIGIDGFYVTGEDDRDKQYNEIQNLLASQPIQTGQPDPENPQVPEEAPSIEVDEIFDNHIIQFEICRKWAVSESGQLAKVENEAGYKNVLLHAKQHLFVLNMGQPQQMDQGANPSKSEPAEQNTGQSMKEAPITGEQDVATIQ